MGEGNHCLCSLPGTESSTNGWSQLFCSQFGQGSLSCVLGSAVLNAVPGRPLTPSPRPQVERHPRWPQLLTPRLLEMKSGCRVSQADACTHWGQSKATLWACLCLSCGLSRTRMLTHCRLPPPSGSGGVPSTDLRAAHVSAFPLFLPNCPSFPTCRYFCATSGSLCCVCCLGNPSLT